MSKLTGTVLPDTGIGNRFPFTLTVIAPSFGGEAASTSPYDPLALRPFSGEYRPLKEYSLLRNLRSVAKLICPPDPNLPSNPPWRFKPFHDPEKSVRATCPVSAFRPNWMRTLGSSHAAMVTMRLVSATLVKSVERATSALTENCESRPYRSRCWAESFPAPCSRW